MNEPGRHLRVAVLGAGLMGAGIAYVFAAAGRAVAVYDPVPAALELGPGRVADMARLLDTDAEAISRAISWHGVLLDTVANADLVIEAAPEDLALKHHLLARVSMATPAAAVIATNTSSIPVSLVADPVEDPARVVGMHFWNPPYLVPLVEVIQGSRTSDATVEFGMHELTAVGMAPVHVRKDVPGAIGNRLQHALKREAIALVAAGVCDAETIDTVCKLGFGARMAVTGPLEQSDMVGLDFTLSVHKLLIPDLDVTPGPHPLLEEKVRLGDLGMKTGSGFRDWKPEEADAVRTRLRSHLVVAAKARRARAVTD